MRYAWAAAALALLVGGCDMAMVSSKPLFDQGGIVLRPGLWAILPQDCTVPADSHVFDWPDCAKPAQLANGALTVFSMAGPVKLSLVASDGMPVILQLSADEDRMKAGASDLYGGTNADLPPGKRRAGQKAQYSYLAFLPDPGNPVTRGMLMSLYCPREANADLRDIRKPPEDTKDDSPQCEVTSAKAVRRVAQQTASDWPKWQAIWIADQPYGPMEDDAMNVTDD